MNRALNKEIAIVTGLLALLGLARRSRTLGAVGGIGLAGCLLASLRNNYSLQSKKVVITGGSRGLGLSLAWNALAQGAEVTLLARDREELVRAREILLGTFPEASVWIDTCDVTNSDELQQSLQLAVHDMGAIDLLINNAGAILVAPFSTMRKEDFEAQMRLHLFAVVEALQMLVPYFKSRGGGRILNICSLGGKVAVPHMLAYDASKFALAGFSQGVAAELAHDGIIVTTAYPTVMRTGSPIQAVFKGDQQLEYEWFNAIDNLPGLSMGPDEAAKKLLQAICDGRTEVVLSIPAKARMMIGALFPETMNFLMKIAARLLPSGTSAQYKTGAEVAGGEWDESRELMYNQKPLHDAEFNLGLRH
jgi:short-subunit dehydrogenase